MHPVPPPPAEFGAPAYTPARQDPTSEVDGFAGADGQLLYYVRALYKRRWIACTTLLAVVVVATVYVFTATSIYEGVARLLIEADEQNVVNFKRVIEEGTDQSNTYYQTQYKLLESRALAAKTIDGLGLWNNVELCASCRPWPTGFRAMASAALDAGVESVRRLVSPSPSTPHGASATPRSDKDEIETPKHTEAIDAFLERLTVSPVKDSRLVDIRFRSTDAALAARVANAHARGYIEANLDFKSFASKEASDWLRDQLAEQRRKVEASEAAVQAYREQNDGVSLEDRENIVVQKLNDVSAAVTRAKTQRIEKEGAYRQVHAIQNDQAALESFPAILSNTFIQQLKQQVTALQRQRAELADRVGDKHPDMIKATTELQAAEDKLKAETAKFVLSVQNDYLAAQAQERSLVEALDAQKHEALALNRKSIDGNVLKRDAESNRQVYEALLQRANETGVSGELKTNNIRLVDLAQVPRYPASPNRRQILLIALLAGILLGVTSAMMAENVDDRIKSPEELAELGVATLGLVPRVSAKLLGPRSLISSGVPLNFAEAFRTVRTSVLFSVPAPVGERPNIFLVTSAGPGDGKTVSATNLAVGIALAGKRVLLIDADMRRPRVHETFGVDQEPGLSNLLVGNARPSDVVRTSDVSNLWLISAGHIPPNPSELLSSDRFEHFLSTLGGHFDWVVVDTPPVLAVTDASIIAHVADGIVFVVGAEKTGRRAAEQALNRLVRSNGRVAGAILNSVKLDEHPYYYSHYYRREYNDYYVKDPLQAAGGGRL